MRCPKVFFFLFFLKCQNSKEASILVSIIELVLCEFIIESFSMRDRMTGYLNLRFCGVEKYEVKIF